MTVWLSEPPTLETYNGHPAASIGEDGDYLLILGHLDEDEARATAVVFWQQEHGDSRADAEDCANASHVSHCYVGFQSHHDGCGFAPGIEGSECNGGCDEYLWWMDDEPRPDNRHPHAATVVR